VPLRDCLQRIGADLRAPFVSFKCFDGYSTSIDMASALHPQTILALDFDGQPLRLNGLPPYGSESRPNWDSRARKPCRRIEVTRTYPGGFWEIRAMIGFPASDGSERQSLIFFRQPGGFDPRCVEMAGTDA